MAIGRLHGARRISRRGHRLFDEIGEAIQALRLRAQWCLCSHYVSGRGAARQLVEAYSNGLPKVHRRLVNVGGNLHQHVAARQVVAGQAMFFRAEDQGDAAIVGQLPLEKRTEARKRDDRLLWLPIGECASSDNESAICHGFDERGSFGRVLEQLGCSDGRPCLTPIRRIRGGDSEVRKAEIRHRACRRADVERIARRDKDHFHAVALGCSEQDMIVVRPISINTDSVGTL